MLCTRNLRFANMRDEEEIFQTNLERCSYRFLQQTAKAMGLPSNVKKVYLIQLINTKNYASPRELDLLVRHIREEQKHRSLVRRISPMNRKKRFDHQSPEISSTNNGLSPPISKTPKRAGQICIQYSPEDHSPMKYPQTVSARRLPITSSDRVLRSSNRVTKPSYLLNNTLLTLLKEPDSDKRTEPRVKIVSLDENKKKVASRIFAKKIIESWQSEGRLALVPRSADISPPLGKRARRLSGVYPLQPEDIKLPSVAVRRADGSISQLKAIIQKPLPQLSSSYDRQTQTDTVNRSLLRAHVTPPVISTQNSTFRSSSSECNSIVKYRSPLSSSFIISQSNMAAVTPSFSNRPSNVSRTTSTLTVATSNISETAQNGYRTSNETEVSPRNSNTIRTASTQMLQNNIRLSSSSDETTLSSTSKGSIQQSREYYHKKIRAEQVRSALRSREIVPAGTAVDNGCRLPRINDVFSKFNSVYSGNVTRPLYVQVDTEHGMAPNPAQIPDPRSQYQGTSTLETIYNLKLPYQPTLQICTTNNTYSVYCTHVMSTAISIFPKQTLQNLNQLWWCYEAYSLHVACRKAHPSSNVVVHSVYNVSSPPRERQPYYTNEYEELPRANDFFSNFHYHEQNNNNHGAPTLDFQRSCSSVETMTSQEQDLGANITIPEMVEDALEIISQDGDYMERMGMDIRMQCILCNWAGPKIILEYHIRKDHPNEIISVESSEFSLSYTLGGLWAQRLWQSYVLQLGGALLVLSAKYDDPDYFMAALSTVSYNPDDPKTGSLTIYNKVTGEPFTWTGAITDLHPSMPYENDPNCFRLQLSKMDLLPNSANLKLLNRELVSKSPTKVIVGQPELDNIQISLVIKIFN